MDHIEQIKSGIETLFKINPNIHISVSKAHPKELVVALPARIVGVYNNIFQVEEGGDSKTSARHAFQYSDVLIGQVRIEELAGVPMVSILNKK